jgi:hypothetical protein
MIRDIAFVVMVAVFVLARPADLRADDCTYMEGWFDDCATCSLNENIPWRTVTVTSCAIYIGICSAFYTECYNYCHGYGGVVTTDWCQDGGEETGISYAMCECFII